MFSKKIVRSMVVALVATGLLVGPAGAAFAAPDRGDGPRAEWRVDVGEWAGVVWGWLLGFGLDGETTASDSSGLDSDRVLSVADGNEQGSGLDPNG